MVVLGASAVYLALMSSIISSLQRKSTEPTCDGAPPLSGSGNPDVQNMWTLLLWIVLILTIKCNADAAAAAAGATATMPASGDVTIDGQRIKTGMIGPVEPFVQYAWVAYLVCLCLPQAKWLGRKNISVFIVFSGLGLAKTLLKLVVSFRASGSFALGKNARLVAGYMAQLVAGGGDGRGPVPRYIVTGGAPPSTAPAPSSSNTPYKIVTYFLLLAVVVVEAWEIVAGVSSNWTKMTLLGHYIRHPSLWRRFGWVQAALAAVLRLRPATRWRDKIGQNSVLEPRRFRRRTGLLALFTDKFYGRAGLMRSVEVEPAVKIAVLRSLRRSYGIPSNGGAAARRVGGGDWAWDGSSSNTDMILAWHVATTLFEMRSKTPASKRDRVAACHLSNYCAYLVAAAPELLPDCTAWTKKRYKKVSDLWAEMVLHVAPSENVKGHVEAMGRGGEFITLVWALLLHAGVTTRPDAPGSAIP
ncbi:hypothetical protein ACP4OV_020930 [Aristida adscensionis]